MNTDYIYLILGILSLMVIVRSCTIESDRIKNLKSGQCILVTREWYYKYQDTNDYTFNYIMEGTIEICKK